jgi:HSP20 family molecular chaperone IbpA
MDIVTSVPVSVKGPATIVSAVEEVRRRVSSRAYENFMERGGAHGRDLDDWLDAERELLIQPAPMVRAEGEDVFVEVVLPEIELCNLTVHIAPKQIVVSSDPEEDGLQVWRVIDLPVEIFFDGVDAELLHNMLRVTAAIAKSQSVSA